MSRFSRVSVAATSAMAALALAACSSSGGKQTEEGGGSAGGVDTPEMTVAFITHAEPGDTFWDQVRAGAEDAAKKNNVKLEYTANPEGAQQANLVQQAVDKKVDGIAVTLAKPEAMKGNVEKAVAAVTEQLLSSAKEIETEEEIAATASISAADPEIGKLIAEAMEKVGKEGVITVEESNTFGLDLELTEGMRFDKGYISQ